MDDVRGITAQRARHERRSTQEDIKKRTHAQNAPNSEPWREKEKMNPPEFDAVLFESMEVTSFDSVAWVNRLIAAAGGGVSESGNGNRVDDEVLLNSVRSASARLQTRSQELSRDAERLMERLLSVGPRAAQELDRVERDATILRQDLKRVQEESKSSTSSTAPFQTLKNLDMIKTNLERCVNVLQETGNWNGLVREMESYFAAKNLGEVASRLTTLRATLETLKDFPEASKRADIMERMEQRLEALVRPGLQNALEQAVNGEYEPLKQSVIVFSKLGRRDALLNDFGQSRGRICFEACWAISPLSPGAPSDEDKYIYSRFLDRVLVHLREVELPICKYAFVGTGLLEETAVSEAMASVIKFCFQHLTGDMVVKLLSPKPLGSNLTNAKQQQSAGIRDVASCERYVVAFIATKRFVNDVSSSLLASGGHNIGTLKDEALQVVARPFVDLNRRYLDWESEALTASLAEHFETIGRRRPGEEDDGLDDVLGPSGWEQRMARVKAEDILEQLTDESLARCEKLGLPSSIPVCRLFEIHASNCLKVVRENRKADDAMRESGLLKTVAELRGRFDTALKKCMRSRAMMTTETSSTPVSPAKSVLPPGSSPRQVWKDQSSVVEEPKEKEAVKRTQEALDQVNAEARQKLFSAFVTPAIVLVDKVVNPSAAELSNVSHSSSMLGPSESITKAVDHLLSLIPMVEFENPLPDLIADPATLGQVERDELTALVGGSPIIYKLNTNTETPGDEEELLRLISSSWLESVGRAMCTAFVLRVLRLKKVSDAYAAQLGADADCLEKNTMLLAQGVEWDPALGVCRIVMSAGPGLTHLKLGNPMEHLDERYCRDPASAEPLRALEHLLVALRNRS